MKGRRLFYASFGVLLFGSSLLVLGSLAGSPDRLLELHQSAITDVPAETLDRALRNVINWPAWFHATEEAKVLDGAGRPYPLKDQFIQTGSIVRISVSTVEIPPDRKVPADKLFHLSFRVIEYAPSRRLHLRLTSDSAHRVTTQFDRLEWLIELVPEAGLTRLEGRALAHTRNWRSRIFGRLAPNYLVQQVFLPSVARLATIRNPSNPNPLPPGMQ